MMKKIIFIFIALQVSIIENSLAQQSTTRRGPLIRKGILVDYNSWGENVNIDNSGSKSTQKAIAYGTGVSFDWAQLNPKSGFGFNVGLISATAVTGKSTDTTGYYVQRNAFLTFRAAGRFFQRINPRFDLGLSPMIFYKQIKWKNTETIQAKTPTNIAFAAALDTRYRLNRQWELHQSIGISNVKNSSITWQVGGGYIF